MTQHDQQSAKKRTRLSAEERRAQILQAVGPHFAEHGYRCTDVQDIADAIGVGKGTIYRYFPTKEELFLATVLDAMKRLSAYLAEQVGLESDPLEKIKTAIRAYLVFFDSYPELVELFVQERAEFPHKAPPIYFQERDSERGDWRPLFDELVARGDFRPLPFNDFANIVGDALYGNVLANRLARRDGSLAQRADALIDIILHGLVQPADPASE